MPHISLQREADFSVKSRTIGLTITGMTALAALVLAAPSALAAPHATASHSTTSHTTKAKAATGWSVTPTGAFKGSLSSGTSVLIKDTTTNQPVTCTTASLTGAFIAGDPGGIGIGHVTAASFGSSTKPCTDTAGTHFTIASNATTAIPWSFNALAYSPSVDGGQTHFGMSDASQGSIITGIKLTLHGTTGSTACTATITGTVQNPAYVRGEYDNTSGLLALITTYQLIVASSNCPSIKTGNTVSFTTIPSSFQVKPVTHGFTLSPKEKFSFTS